MGFGALGGVFRTINIAGSGMRIERQRMEIIAENLANSQKTMTRNGEPYRRKIPIFEQVLEDRMRGVHGGGVRMAGVYEDPSPFPEFSRPGHPHADPQSGMLRMPNVNVTYEMVDLLASSRSYEANIKASTLAKEMAEKALTLGSR